MTRMPRIIRIGRFRFSVTRNPKDGITRGMAMEELAPSSCDLGPREQKVFIKGLCWWNKQRIYVAPRQPLACAQEVLLHEVMHALWALSGLSEGSKTLAAKEESVVTALSAALIDVMHRNPQLVRYLAATDNKESS